MKRALVVGFSVFLFAAAALVLAPPDRLKQWVLSQASKKLAQKTPYEFRVTHVSGNLLTGFDFSDVTIFTHKDHAEVFRTPLLTVRINVWSFIRRHVIQIDSLRVEAGGGEVILKGHLTRSSNPEGSFRVEAKSVALEKIHSPSVSQKSLLHLVHSGTWNVSLSSQVWTVEMAGRLGDAPVEAHGVWGPQVHYRVHGTWNRASLYSVWRDPQVQGVHLSSKFNFYGEGASVNGTMRFASLQDSPSAARSFDGRIRFKEGNGVFDLAFGERAAPSRISGSVKIPQSSASHPPRARFSITSDLPKGLHMEAAGHATSYESHWTVNLNKFLVSFPGQGTWVAKPGSSVVRYVSGRIDIRQFHLQNGAQSIQIPHAFLLEDSGELDLTIRALDPSPWLALALPTLTARGQLNASLRARGRLRHPDIDGYVTASLPSVTVEPIGLAIHDLEMDLRSTSQTLEVRRFLGKTNKGQIQITGHSRWDHLDYLLVAQELELENKTHSKGTADVSMRVSGTLEHPVFAGRVSLKDGVYHLPAKVNDKKESSSPSTVWLRAALDIRADWPRKVWVRDGLTNIETSADVRIQKQPAASAVRLSGSIRSIRGSYNYVGRDFTIESGVLQFDGTPGFNPLMNIVASYRRDPTVVYLDISGTAEKPALKMRSNPPLSDQDMMSVIVFGQPLNELRSKSGGLSTNQAAMQAAGGVLGSYLSRSLRESGLEGLNVDVLNIEPAQEGSQLTVGRYLTRKLFVSYGQAIRGSAQKSITADYFLTDKWTLQGASDSLQGNSMNFLFRYPLDKRSAMSNTPVLPASPFRNTLDPRLPNQPKGR